MLFPLIFRIPIYIFLLLSISTAFCDLFAILNLISGRFCNMGLFQPLGFSLLLLIPSCFLQRLHFIIY